MLDYLIVSDSHGRRERLSELVAYRKKLLKDGEVLHLVYLGDGLDDLFSLSCYGDIIVYAVRGNCDMYDRLSPLGEEIPLCTCFYAGGYKVMITHGHSFSVKGGLDELCREACRLGADIVLYGHTHLPRLEYIKRGEIRGVDRDLALFNPGSLGSLLDGSFGNLSVSDNGFLLSHGSFSNIGK